MTCYNRLWAFLCGQSIKPMVRMREKEEATGRIILLEETWATPVARLRMTERQTEISACLPKWSRKGVAVVRQNSCRCALSSGANDVSTQALHPERAPDLQIAES